MKENLPNDGLEKFLKKSFEGYEDTPSGNLWDKISGDLDAPAAALFVGVIAAQFIYFQTRIDNLSQEVDNQKIKVEKIDKSKENNNLNESENATPLKENLDEDIKSGIVETGKTNSSENSTKSKSTPSSISDFEKASSEIKSSNNTTQNTQIITAPTSEITTILKNLKAPTDKNKQVRNADKLPPSSLEDSDLPLFYDENVVDQDEKVEQTSNNFFNKNLKNEVVETTNEQLKNIVFLPLKNAVLPIEESVLGFEKMPDVLAQVAKISPIRNQRKGISIGVAGGFFKTTETVKGDIRAGFKPPSNRHFAVGFQEQSTIGTTQTGGLNFKIDLTENWSLIPGLMYRKDIFKSTKNSSVEFGDFRHSGSSSREHEIDFFRHTTGGTISTEIEIENSDGGSIDDNEKVKITSQLTREKESIAFPVALNYGLNQGDWHFNFGGGIVFNKLIKNNQELIILDVEHPRVKSDFQTKDKNKVNVSHLRNSNLDGIFYVGIEYELTDHFSLALNPTILFDLTERSRFLRVDSDVFSIGMNAGVNYNF